MLTYPAYYRPCMTFGCELRNTRCFALTISLELEIKLLTTERPVRPCTHAVGFTYSIKAMLISSYLHTLFDMIHICGGQQVVEYIFYD